MAKLALCFTLAVVLAVSMAAVAWAAGVYVALGDSYTSAPLVPNQHGEPIDCGRADHNYPSLVAGALNAGTFVDVSCGSAETKHMTEPQTGLPLGGTNPPQFHALRADATLVTVGIGGNDAGLVGVAEKCAELGLLDPMGTSCRDHWAPGGNDQVAAKIEATKPRIAAVLQGIHQRSPSARVAIVGYPDVLPKSGSCWPMVPLSPDDVRYIDELIVRINSMIAGQAAANKADYVDTYADSGGHDVCKLPPERSKRSRGARVELALSTAPSQAFRRAYPRRQRIARGLFFASRHSNRLIWTRRGKVAVVAVMTKRVRADYKRLGRDLRLALR